MCSSLFSAFLDSLGRLLNRIFLRAQEQTDDDAAVSQESLGKGVFQPLFQVCILSKDANAAERFRGVLKSALGERKTGLDKVIFRASIGVVWKYIDVSFSGWFLIFSLRTIKFGSVRPLCSN